MTDPTRIARTIYTRGLRAAWAATPEDARQGVTLEDVGAWVRWRAGLPSDLAVEDWSLDQTAAALQALGSTRDYHQGQIAAVDGRISGTTRTLRYWAGVASVTGSLAAWLATE